MAEGHHRHRSAKDKDKVKVSSGLAPKPKESIPTLNTELPSRIKPKVKNQSAPTIRFKVKIRPAGLGKRRLIYNEYLHLKKATAAQEPGLRRKYMPGGSTDEEIEMSFMNILNVDAFGDSENFRVWVDITLGEASAATEHEVMLDTASAVTWVSRKDYVDARNAQDLRPPPAQRARVQLGYTGVAGSIEGELFEDTLTIGNISITKQLFAVLHNIPASVQNAGVEGVLGVGPKRLSKGTIVGRPNASIDTVLESMIKQNGVQARIIGINLKPIDDATSGDGDALIKGTIHFGGTRSENPLKYTPATLIAPASNYYGVNLALKYGSSTTVMPSSPGIIDTGSQFIYLSREHLDKILGRLSGLEYDSNLQMWSIPNKDKNKLRDLKFYFNDISDPIVFPPSAQVWPPRLNSQLDPGTKADRLYLVIRELPQATSGRQFILGLAWIQRYYVAIDASNAVGTGTRIGIAKTSYTDKKWAGF